MGATSPRRSRMVRKVSRHLLVVQKVAVHERELVADELREVGMQCQSPLLRVQKHAHQPARRVAENAAGRGVDFAVDEFESVHGFAASRRRWGSQARSEEQARAPRASSAMRCSSVRVMRKMFRMCV